MITACGDGNTTISSEDIDTTAPVVTVTGSATMNLTVGDTFTDAGATANDDVDGTLSITTTGSVDTTTAGTYTIMYTAIDNAGNTATSRRTVIVAESEIEEEVRDEILTGFIDSNITLTADKIWFLDGEVIVSDGVTLTIEPGTTIAGKEGTLAALAITSNAKLIAEGTKDAPILFTSEEAILGEEESPAQWGGLVIYGNEATVNQQRHGYYVVGDNYTLGNSGDSSGSLKFLTINNTGAYLGPELDALGLVYVSSSTTVENISINRSYRDGIAVWGGSVNLKDIVIDGAQDDSFDTDSGWTGEVDGLTITNGRNAGIEMSGTSVATYKNVDITVDSADSEGGIYFKSFIGDRWNQEYGQRTHTHEVVGGVFENVTVTYNSAAKGAINVTGDFDEINSSFTNVTLTGSNPNIVANKSPDDDNETAEVQALFDTGSGNSVQ